MAEVASLIARALRGREDEGELASVRGEVRELCQPVRPLPGWCRVGRLTGALAARGQVRDGHRREQGYCLADSVAAMPGLATGVSKKPSPSFSTLIGMGVATALCIAVGVGGGYWLDRTFHTGELLTFVGLALGVVAAVVVVYSDVKTFL